MRTTRTIFSILLILLQSVSILAQFQEAQILHRHSPYHPQILATADVDADGDLDLMLSGGWLEKLSTYEYGDYHRFDESYSFSKLLPADLEGDGDIDFIAETTFGGNPFVLQLSNDGQAQFSLESLFPGRALALGNLDQDAMAELIYAPVVELGPGETQSATISQYSVSGFDEGQEMEMQVLYHKLRLVDSNNDGILDILKTQGSPTELWLGSGDGTFAHTWTAAAESTYANSEANLWHFDDDEVLDLVQLGGSQLVTVNLGDAQGSFSEAIAIESGDLQYLNGFYSRFADVDGDGFVDILTLRSQILHIALNDQQMGFDVFEQAVPNATQIAGVADLTEDGTYELVTSILADQESMLYDFEGGLVDTLLSLRKNQLGGFLYYEASDLDLDGDLDLVFNCSQSGLSWLENTEAGFGDLKILNDFKQHKDLVIFDKNLDGKQDMYTISDTQIGWIYYWQANEDNLWELQDSIDLYNAHAARIEAADLDGDGYKDLIGFIDSKWQVLYSDTYGHFAAPYLLPASSSTQGVFTNHMQLLDYDGDGDLDFFHVVRLGTEYELEYLINLGDQSFAEPQILTSLSSFDFHLSDLNNDGLWDIVCEDSSIGLRVLIQQEGIFIEQQVFADQELDQSRFAFLDIEQDGDEDFITQNEVFINDGAGFFERTALSLNSEKPPLIVGDFIGDHRLDVIADYRDSKLVLFENITAQPALTEQKSIPKMELRIYPNPTAGPLELQFSSRESQDLWLQVSSIDGQLLHQEHLGLITAGQVFRHRLDSHMEDLPAGHYIVAICSPKTILSSTIVELFGK